MNVKIRVKKCIKQAYAKYKWRKQVKKAIAEAKQCALAPSYYPELELKSKHERIIENIEWAKKYGEANKFYTLYGLDRKGSNVQEYMDYYHFMTSRNIANHMWQIDSQLELLRDKFLFYKYMKACNFPVPEVFAIWKTGKLYDVNFHELEWKEIECKIDYFIKSIDGECASFVKHVSNWEEASKVKNEFEKKGVYIFQERVVQSKEMNILNPNAINTYRIVTINKDGKTSVLSVILRVGTNNTGNVDNWVAGGLAVGINENGYLKEYGFYKPMFGTKTDIHPDTKVKFSDFHAPEYLHAVELACRAHKAFYGIRSIGWDVAISEKGPVFIEGNDNWEISLMQACD